MQNPQAPPVLGKVFAFSDRVFFYDTGLNQILEIDPALAAALSPTDHPGMSDPDQRHARHFSPREIEAARHEILSARTTEGAFLPASPEMVPRNRGDRDRDRYEDSLAHLTLTLTEDCNLRCKYCPHTNAQPWTRPHGNRSMSAATAIKATRFFLERCAKTERPCISLYGGEPLLAKPIIRTILGEIRRHPRGPRIRTTVDTNGTLIDDEFATLVAAERLHLQISLDGPPHIHDNYRLDKDGGPTYLRVLSGVRRVLEADRSAVERISFVATVGPPYDFLGIANFFDEFPLFKELGIQSKPRVRMNLPIKDSDSLWRPFESGDAMDLQLGYARARKAYVSAHAKNQRKSLPPALREYFDGGLIRFHHRSRSPLAGEFSPTAACRPGIRKLHVRYDGQFQPCERVGESLIIGDADQGFDLPAIERAYAELFDAVRARCQSCWALRLCTLCFTSMAPTWEATGQSPASVDERRCAAVRANALHSMTLYLELRSAGPNALDWLARTALA
jgi:uncharacterized protein